VLRGSGGKGAECMCGGGLRSRRCWCRVSEYSMVEGIERAEKALPR